MCHATMSGNKRSKSITESGFELVLNYSDELINKEISLSYQRKKKERKKLLPFLLKTVNFISYLPLYCKHRGEFFNIVLSKNRQLCPDSGQEQRDILFHFYTTAVQSLFTPYGNMDIFLWPALVTGLTNMLLLSQQNGTGIREVSAGWLIIIIRLYGSQKSVL